MLVLLSFEREVMGLIALPVGEGIAQAGRMIMRPAFFPYRCVNQAAAQVRQRF